MKRLDGYMGTFPANRIPRLFYTKQHHSGDRFCIANTNTLDNPENGHWVAICKHGGQVSVYDSFGRSSKDLSGYYDDEWNIADDDKEQEIDEINCGARCCAFIFCCKEFSVDDALRSI